MVNNRFLIGHYGRYDRQKQTRDFREGFYGVELCSFNNEEDIKAIVKDATAQDFNYGIHLPLRSGRWRLRDAQYLSKSSQCQKESYSYMEDEIAYACKYHPDYILFHFPKPMLLDTRVDWSNWRFADSSEHYWENEYPYQLFLEECNNFFTWLRRQAELYKFVPVLEFDLVNKYIYNNEEFYQLFSAYPEIKVCLDIARLHVQRVLDKYFPVDCFIKQYARHTYLVHLSNVSVKKKINHYPALPTLDPDEGWADIKMYLQKIKSENNQFKLLFEHWSNAVNEQQLQECYDWITEILAEEKGKVNEQDQSIY